MVTTITSQTEFDLFKSNGLAVVHFYADWSEPCQHMNNILNEIASDSEFQNVKIAKCLAEDLPEVSIKYDVFAVPKFVLFRNGDKVDVLDGADPIQLNKKIQALLTKGNQKEQKVEDINLRLKSLINSAPVMLFIKGSKSQPKCKFSTEIINLFKELGAEFSTFDILEDQVVREKLKVYSNWPTYPQLYLNGELVGGLDIVKELLKTGELKDLLKLGKSNLNDRLKSLINKADVMAFIKGSKQLARCGFSNQLIQILNQTGIDYETFDILSDEEVRQGLKEYSDWPTYPQVYVKGSLIGGLDIIKELKDSGELIATLKGEI
ncbi:Glutaredoxin,Thioredoxin-like fold,Glutaredoxin, PICOT-like,Monothiol glutaredoxin-related,Thioredoxin [Cinara cedri]|uniref:Glutaredoxin,Thioredoxin-like fold,Glutaredoxin, PICOT-like,Monothiol glutaredoxin-related,Thioredoxin n=1 Tax=Cinara cedri TaxID=506608 RepID=A0A5E4M1K6_9HEMI|nr:Glutaredoxin,Thioredoxin-like fold,Glutaredoxin, PICOT-like,Monothiol glutaredoxin-related,Thioredoxin [Cinara cedri]